MSIARTMHDIRTLRSASSRAIPMNEGAVFLQLHRLASEKLRLEREAELWLRRKERIEKRLAEIEQQMENLRQFCPNATAETKMTRPKKAWRPVTIEY